MQPQSQDAGQPRAFFVKLTEGADDHGGPYRAVFQTALGEEEAGLLDILVPCENGLENAAENRDKVTLSPSACRGQDSHGGLLHELGRLMGLAHRHGILVPLSLPQVVWAPLTSQPLRLADLQAIDFSLVNSLSSLSGTVNSSTSSCSAEAPATPATVNTAKASSRLASAADSSTLLRQALCWLGLKSSLTERLLREAREAEAEAEADADADADVEADSDAESKAEVEPSPLHALCGLFST